MVSGSFGAIAADIPGCFPRLVLRSSCLHERVSGVCLPVSVEAGSHGLSCQLATQILAYESHCYGWRRTAIGATDLIVNMLVVDEDCLHFKQMVPKRQVFFFGCFLTRFRSKDCINEGKQTHRVFLNSHLFQGFKIVFKVSARVQLWHICSIHLKTHM